MQDAPPQPSSRARTFVGTLVLALIAFGAGYVPKDIEVRRLEKTLKSTQLELRLAELHRRLGVASHEAQRNNFPAAANAGRAFFEGCRALAQEEAFTDQPRTRTAISTYGGYGDQVLGQLAAGDPAVKQKLADLFIAMEGVLQRRL